MNDSKALVIRDQRGQLLREERIRVLAQWEASGLSARRFGEQMGLEPYLLYDWRRAARRASSTAELVEVPRTVEMAGWAAEVATARAVVRLSSSASPQWAAQLLRELGRC